MAAGTVSHRAALIAVVVALLAGLVGSLALRPPGGGADAPAAAGDGAVAERVRWRMPVSFPTTIPVIGENPVEVAEAVHAASGGALAIEVFEPGEVVPAFGITDAVRDGKVEAGYTFLGYDQGKTPASALFAAVPFGLEPMEFIAWWYEAGGRELGENLYRQYHAKPIMCGISGPETAGWFRTRIETLDDLAGLKIRFAGLGGKVLERIGASVTLIPGGEIFQALEKGAIDATEFSLPIVDQRLGFDRIAPFNYYPGWHQPATTSHLLVNLDAWRALTAAEQAVVEAACAAGVARSLAASEAHQGAVIAGFPEAGVSAESFPLALLREIEAVTETVLEEEAARDADFREIHTSQQRFRAEYAHWKTRAYLPRDF